MYFDCTVFPQSNVLSVWCCKNCCNEILTFFSWLHRLTGISIFLLPLIYKCLLPSRTPIYHFFHPPLTLFSFSFLTPVATVTTKPSSPRFPCWIRHAHESLTLSRWCPSQPPLRATMGAEGAVSQWPSTSHSAPPMATALSMDTLSESPSECPVFVYACIICGRCVGVRKDVGRMAENKKK